MQATLTQLFYFRNDSHESWFYSSMSILLVCLLIWLFFWFRDQFRFLIHYHMGAVLGALVVVLFWRSSWPYSDLLNRLYSVDCIWFNGLLPGVHLALYRFLPRKKAKIFTEMIGGRHENSPSPRL